MNSTYFRANQINALNTLKSMISLSLENAFSVIKFATGARTELYLNVCYACLYSFDINLPLETC